MSGFSPNNAAPITSFVPTYSASGTFTYTATCQYTKRPDGWVDFATTLSIDSGTPSGAGTLSLPVAAVGNWTGVARDNGLGPLTMLYGGNGSSCQVIRYDNGAGPGAGSVLMCSGRYRWK